MIVPPATGIVASVAAEVDELGQRTAYRYDERGNLIERMGPDGAKLSVAYGSHDLPVHAVDAIGGEWSWSYDPRGRVLERKDPLGRVLRFHYHAQWLVGITDPAGGYSALGYDRAGNLELRLRCPWPPRAKDLSRPEHALGLGRQRSAARVGGQWRASCLPVSLAGSVRGR